MTYFIDLKFLLTFETLCLYLPYKVQNTMKKTKNKAGRKKLPKNNKKVAFKLYITPQLISDNGGKEATRIKCINLLEGVTV